MDLNALIEERFQFFRHSYDSNLYEMIQKVYHTCCDYIMNDQFAGMVNIVLYLIRKAFT